MKLKASTQPNRISQIQIWLNYMWIAWKFVFHWVLLEWEDPHEQQDLYYDNIVLQL